MVGDYSTDEPDSNGSSEEDAPAHAFNNCFDKEFPFNSSGVASGDAEMLSIPVYKNLKYCIDNLTSGLLSETRFVLI